MNTLEVLNARNTELIEKLQAVRVIYVQRYRITASRHAGSNSVAIALTDSAIADSKNFEMAEDDRLLVFDSRQTVDLFINALTEIRSCLI